MKSNFIASDESSGMKVKFVNKTLFITLGIDLITKT